MLDEQRTTALLSAAAGEMSAAAAAAAAATAAGDAHSLRLLEAKISDKLDYLVRAERRKRVIHAALLSAAAWSVYCQCCNWFNDVEIVRCFATPPTTHRFLVVRFDPERIGALGVAGALSRRAHC